MNFLRTAIHNGKIAIFLAFLIAGAGIYSYFVLPKQESPDVTPPVALLTTIYPGASPEEIQDLVTKPLEEAVSELSGFDYVISRSSDNLSVVVLFLDVDADPEETWRELRRKVADVQRDLPDGCYDPEVNTKLSETAGIIISLSGENYTYEQLESFAEDFKGELSKVDGIARFEIVGKVERQVDVEVKTAELNRHALSFYDLLRLFRAQNTQIPTGYLDDEQGRINVNTPGIFESLGDIEDTIIAVSTEDGSVVRVGHVARVSMGLERDSVKYRQNGQNAVLLVGYFQPGENIVLIGHDVRQKIEQVKQLLPEDLLIDEVVYQPEDVDHAISNFMTNVWQGIALVILIVFLGMGFRNAIIVSFAIPLSILTTFSIMYGLDIYVHHISTAALIIALGMLVDNAIVISDAAQVRIDAGEERRSAALEGVRESAVPVLSATLTTIAAFSPLMSIPGPAGEFLLSLPEVVIISLLVSFFVALLVTPAMAAIFFRPKRPRLRWIWAMFRSITFRRRTPEDRGSSAPVSTRRSILRKLFLWLLRGGLRFRKSTLLLVLAIFASALYSTQFLKEQFFPAADTDVMYVDIISEKIHLDDTDRLVRQVEQLLVQQPEVKSTTTAVGAGVPKFYMTAPVRIKASDSGQILFRVDLSRGGRFKTSAEFAEYLQELVDSSISGGKATVKRLEATIPKAAKVQVRVSGDDINRLREFSQQLQAELDGIAGTMNVRDDAPNASFEFMVDIDDDVATSFGITKYDVQTQIAIALGGATASVFRIKGKEYNIVIEGDIRTKEQLENLAIKSSITNQKVLLKQIASIGLHSRYDLIKRYNRETSISVLADVRPGHGASDIENTLENDVLPRMDLDGVDVVFDGEREEIRKNFGNLGVAGLIALCLIYIILMIQFRSFSQPFVILLTVPLSLTGSIFGLLLFSQPLSFTAFLGIVSLFGIVVNNAILLIEFINRSREQGMGLDEACWEAVDQRFRPIMMSTTTTIFGLVPLAASGSDLFGPMSVSLMSGLIVSTLLTLIIVPVVYRMIVGVTSRFG